MNFNFALLRILTTANACDPFTGYDMLEDLDYGPDAMISSRAVCTEEILHMGVR